MTDLVLTLRAASNKKGSLCDEAADAIERLRAELAKSQAAVEWMISEHEIPMTDYLAGLIESHDALCERLRAERGRCAAAIHQADNCECGVPCDCFGAGSAIHAIRALPDE